MNSETMRAVGLAEAETAEQPEPYRRTSYNQRGHEGHGVSRRRRLRFIFAVDVGHSRLVRPRGPSGRMQPKVAVHRDRRDRRVASSEATMASGSVEGKDCGAAKPMGRMPYKM